MAAEMDGSDSIYPYDLGHLRNFKAVFGDNPWFWLLPVSVDQKKEHEIVNWPLNSEFNIPRPSRAV